MKSPPIHNAIACKANIWQWYRVQFCNRPQSTATHYPTTHTAAALSLRLLCECSQHVMHCTLHSGRPKTKAPTTVRLLRMYNEDVICRAFNLFSGAVSVHGRNVRNHWRWQLLVTAAFFCEKQRDRGADTTNGSFVFFFFWFDALCHELGW